MAARRRYSTRRRGEPEDEDDDPRRRPQTRGIPASAYAAGVLAVTGAVVLYIVIQMQPRQDPEAAETTTEAVDPFEGLARDEPPPPRKGSGRPKRPAPSSTGDDPFAGLRSGIRDDPLWIAAVEQAEHGMELSDEAALAKSDGDFALFKERGKEAKKLLEAAVDATRDWELEIAKQYGYDDVDVRRVIGVRKRWIDELVALKKTVGL